MATGRKVQAYVKFEVMSSRELAQRGIESTMREADGVHQCNGARPGGVNRARRPFEAVIEGRRMKPAGAEVAERPVEGPINGRGKKQI